LVLHKTTDEQLIEKLCREDVSQIWNMENGIVLIPAVYSEMLNLFSNFLLLINTAISECNDNYYTGCRKINVFQVGGLVGKNLMNLEKIKEKI
jgi:hypothetical protein